jgi:hypothetical protein
MIFLRSSATRIGNVLFSSPGAGDPSTGGRHPSFTDATPISLIEEKLQPMGLSTHLCPYYRFCMRRSIKIDGISAQIRAPQTIRRRATRA